MSSLQPHFSWWVSLFAFSCGIHSPYPHQWWWRHLLLLQRQKKQSPLFSLSPFRNLKILLTLKETTRAKKLPLQMVRDFVCSVLLVNKLFIGDILVLQKILLQILTRVWTKIKLIHFCFFFLLISVVWFWTLQIFQLSMIFLFSWWGVMQCTKDFMFLDFGYWCSSPLNIQISIKIEIQLI